MFGLVGPESNPVLESKPKTGPYNWRRLWGELDLIRRRFRFSAGNGRVRFAPTNDQGNVNPHQAESGNSQHNNSVVNPQQRGDHEGSVQTTHTSKSQSRGKSHVSHAKNERDMQREIDELKKKLRRARRRRSSPESESSSEETDDATYK